MIVNHHPSVFAVLPLIIFRILSRTMAMLIKNSVPAMHEGSQLFSVPVFFSKRWRTKTERLNPNTVLTDDGATGDINFFIPPSSNGFLDSANVTLEPDLAVQVKTDDSNGIFLRKTTWPCRSIKYYIHYSKVCK